MRTASTTKRSSCKWSCSADGLADRKLVGQRRPQAVKRLQFCEVRDEEHWNRREHIYKLIGNWRHMYRRLVWERRAIIGGGRCRRARARCAASLRGGGAEAMEGSASGTLLSMLHERACRERRALARYRASRSSRSTCCAQPCLRMGSAFVCNKSTPRFGPVTAAAVADQELNYNL